MESGARSRRRTNERLRNIPEIKAVPNLRGNGAQRREVSHHVQRSGAQIRSGHHAVAAQVFARERAGRIGERMALLSFLRGVVRGIAIHNVCHALEKAWSRKYGDGLREIPREEIHGNEAQWDAAAFNLKTALCGRTMRKTGWTRSAGMVHAMTRSGQHPTLRRVRLSRWMARRLNSA